MDESKNIPVIGRIVGLALLLALSACRYTGEHDGAARSSGQSGRHGHVTGQLFPVDRYVRAVTDSVMTIRRDGVAVVMVLGREGCHPGQGYQMQRLDTLFRRQGGRIPMVGLYIDDVQPHAVSSRAAALRLRKVGRATFDVGYSTDPDLIAFMQGWSYPAIFVLKDHRILAGLWPRRTRSASGEDPFVRLSHLLGVHGASAL
ncbi:MAG: hypothetical protein D6685_06025 [Bacteroidetes bacterium]|nr:MAG: hypothetical protein D6685_06025 [Bacteroidota bacterium]